MFFKTDPNEFYLTINYEKCKFNTISFFYKNVIRMEINFEKLKKDLF